MHGALHKSAIIRLDHDADDVTADNGRDAAGKIELAGTFGVPDPAKVRRNEQHGHRQHQHRDGYQHFSKAFEPAGAI